MLSIIIPTLNEEEYLPRLLDSIRRQNFSDAEIIIADAGSKDRTVEIAKQYGCSIVEGGLPAKARNNGATYAQGDVLFFLDADTVLPDNFIENSLNEFSMRGLGIASFMLMAKNTFSNLLIDIFYNKLILITEKILPHSAMGILAQKEIFKKIHGYDETITLAEDHDLGRRAAKHAKFGVIKSAKIITSDRRFKEDGWVGTGVKYLLCELHMIFLGPVRSNIFKYKFGHYKK